MWEENCIEHELFNERPYAMQEYFSKYKYWLKREFKFQRSK
jgi:alpha-beta hydrolase superfamily lysophospholipase